MICILTTTFQPDLPSVLHNLDFEIRPGVKVGILGRTGSGKSTLALSFFRFVEPVEGRILVDGLDISKIGLTDLRSKLTIIPRECQRGPQDRGSLAFRPPRASWPRSVPLRVLLTPFAGAPQRTPRF